MTDPSWWWVLFAGGGLIALGLLSLLAEWVEWLFVIKPRFQREIERGDIE